ncbi:hypothetical protein IMSHALPRED_010981 [Imshaugia aleurites]|uniref:Uncharacterized protein n=1 Tax=Imshaugia aleurites TaxID=172621 RepID=A0A8H3G8Z3_9LECA|nr:hypothetical protein IMSHALPRED_010981 [Imshaugia aleurites]
MASIQQTHFSGLAVTSLSTKKKLQDRGTNETFNWKQRYRENLVRPWVMLFTEPIVWALSIYTTFLYGVMPLSLVAYPVVYSGLRGWSVAKTSLRYVGLAVGMAIATVGSPLLNRAHTRFVRKLSPIPEARFPLQIGFSWLIPLGLFWFAWTAAPPVPAAIGIAAGVPFGIGLLTAFLEIAAYLTDCYGRYGASALAANGVLCRLFGAAFPLFADRLYGYLGVGRGTSVLAFIAAAMAPMPLVFYCFGATLRERSVIHKQVTREV